jgi:hypothetical protein
MSIDAQVKSVYHNEDGSGQLNLIDRPATRRGETPGTAGQKVLRFDSAPHDVTALNGRNIWGNANSVMLGDREFAKRDGYTKIVFTVPDFHGWVMP